MALKLEGLGKIPPKQKVFLAILVCALAGAGYYYLFYQEAAKTRAQLESQLAGLESKIKEQSVIAKNLPQFKAEVAELEKQLAVLLEQLPNSAEIPNLLRNVSDLGRESGLEFLKFAPGAEVQKDFYAAIPVAIQVRGEYNTFALFADRVSHLPRIVNLSNIRFDQPKRDSDRMMLTVNCTATTYRFLEQAKPAPAPTKGKPK